MVRSMDLQKKNIFSVNMPDKDGVLVTTYSLSDIKKNELIASGTILLLDQLTS